MSQKKILLLGANNPEVARIISCMDQDKRSQFAGYIDNAPQKKGQLFYGLPVLGGFEILPQLDPTEYKFVNLITRDCITRHQTTLSMSRFGFEMTNFIHPGLDTGMVTLGEGLYLQGAAILQAEVVLANNVSISAGAIVGHETHIGESSFLAPGVTVSGCVNIACGVFIGSGASIVPRVSIGDWSIIGAGSVITRDVSAGAVMVGNPARILRMQDIPEF
ncbi:hypothetical protein [Iodobacter sp.]|uniref:hypothetical protein n=1 Tax=Iodobacter sp. TaxID=1915058 RepID=UPI0025F5F9CA|nr:hypothetical protein [Iodobacter sp.]